jgi:hypothetical protein
MTVGRWRLVAGVSAAAMLVAGCGGDDGPQTVEEVLGTETSAATEEPEPEPDPEPEEPEPEPEPDDEPLYAPLPELEPDPDNDIPDEVEREILEFYAHYYEIVSHASRHWSTTRRSFRSIAAAGRPTLLLSSLEDSERGRAACSGCPTRRSPRSSCATSVAGRPWWSSAVSSDLRSGSTTWKRATAESASAAACAGARGSCCSCARTTMRGEWVVTEVAVRGDDGAVPGGKLVMRYLTVS